MDVSRRDNVSAGSRFLPKAVPYKYSPLEHPDSIRLLLLEPSEDFDSPLFCTIKHVRFSDGVPEYTAISYTWGDLNQTQPVYFDEGRTKLEVSVNGSQALRHLREIKRNTLLWMDAICIDQGAIDERSRQVRLMDGIYDRAKDVIVHLGEHTDGSRVLFEELAKAYEMLSSKLSLSNRETPNQRIVEAMDEVFERPWFKRVWVLQEVHAKSSVYLMCGSDFTSSEAFKECYAGYGCGQITQRRWPFPMRLRDANASQSVNKSAHYLLWEHLLNSRTCLASDPRDKVFAVISLLREKRSVVDHLIDYHKPVEKVYTDAAVEFLSVIGLELLNAIRHPHTLDMPSWIPDWSSTLALDHSRFNRPEIWSTIEKAAQQEPKAWLATEEETLVLYARGIRYATIRIISPPIFFRDLKDAQHQQTMLDHYFKKIYGREIMGPRIGYESPSTDQDEYMQLVQVCRSEPAIEDGLNRLSGNQFQQFFNRGSPYINRRFFFRNIERFFQSQQHRSIALLDNGHLSLVPDAAVPGDVLFFVQHCRYPSLLRRSSSEIHISTGIAWKVISGDCTLSNFDDRHTEFHEEEENLRFRELQMEELKIV